MFDPALEQLRTAVEASPDSLALHRVIRDASGACVDLEVLFQSATAVTQTGFAADAVVGRRLLEVAPALAQTERWRSYCRAADSGERTRDEHVKVVGGEACTIETTAVRIADDVIAIWGRDITEQARAPRRPTPRRAP
ncbi:MAG: PAS domain-containing protein [Myxococcota bacterium]